MEEITNFQIIFPKLSTKPDSHPCIKNAQIIGQELAEKFGTPSPISQWISLNHQNQIEEDQFLEIFSNIQKERIYDENIFQTIQHQVHQLENLMSQITNGIQCFYCYEREVDTLYIPCGHIITCRKCHRRIHETCQQCGTIIREHHHVFL